MPNERDVSDLLTKLTPQTLSAAAPFSYATVVNGGSPPPQLGNGSTQQKRPPGTAPRGPLPPPAQMLHQQPITPAPARQGPSPPMHPPVHYPQVPPHFNFHGYPPHVFQHPPHPGAIPYPAMPFMTMGPPPGQVPIQYHPVPPPHPPVIQTPGPLPQRNDGKGIVGRLEQRVAEALLPHLPSTLQDAALAILLLTGATDGESGDDGAWFQSRLRADEGGPWEVALASWMMPALTALEMDDAVAMNRIEAGLRALLDTYILGGNLPMATVLYSTWSDSLLPDGPADMAAENHQGGQQQKQRNHQPQPVKMVDFFGTVSALLHLPGSGVRLLPFKPASLQAAAVVNHEAPALWEGPLGRPRPVPESMGAALSTVDEVVRSAGRDVRKLLCSPLLKGLVRSPDVDFGVWPYGSLQRTLFRQVWIRNAGKKPLWLLDIRALPSGGPKAFLLDDDFGLASEEKGLPPSLGIFCGDEGGGEDDSALSQPEARRMRVCLKESDAYVVTIQLDPQVRREGMLAAAVVATLAWEGSKESFCVGWRASATLVPSAVVSKLRPEAPPFVPHWQQVFFDSPANLSTLEPRELHEMLRMNLSFTCQTAEDVSPCVLEQQVAGSWQQSSLGLKFWTALESNLKLACDTPSSEDPENPEEMQHRARRRAILVRMARALAVEEATMESDIRKYDMFGVRPELCQHNPGSRKYTVLRLGSEGRTGYWNGFQADLPKGKLGPSAPTRDFLMIEVKGIVEKRPDVAMGDTVFLRLEVPGYAGRQEFACLVVAIDREHVALMAPPAWWVLFGTNSSRFPPVNIRLGFDKILLRRMGAALVRAATHRLELFPEVSPVSAHDSYVELLQGNDDSADVSTRHQAAAEKLELHNPQLNREQREAVARAVALASPPDEPLEPAKPQRPFILFGPAGTGKTLTLAEVVLQAMKAKPEGRILACAPTSDTADVFCLGLAKAGLTPETMVRLNDVRRSPVTVRPGAMEFCMLQKHVPGGSRRPVFSIDMDVLSKAKVIVASCSAAAVLDALVSSSGGFDFVVMDEAAQAMIPEALIPLTLAAPTGSSIVLAGDPRQMGPVVRCQYSAAGPALKDSLQQQWLRCTGASAPDVCILPRNYRSSASLLELPSRLFYNECLIAEAPEETTRPPEWEELLVGPEDGSVGGGGHREIMFYGVMGKQVAKDPMVPSWSNPLEAHRCAELVAGLLAESGRKGNIDGDANGSRAALREEDIGIMAPFRKQVYEIRRLLRAKNLGQVNVGTVDDFQGQEARVIFISTTLTRVASLRQTEGDASEIVTIPTLLSDMQRFCVAITRAQALLVVVGHPVLLLEANTWRNVITHCAARGAYKGAGSETLAAKLGRGLVPEFEDGEEEHLFDDQGDLDDAVAAICQMAVLGSGDADSLFPDLDLPETLAAAYSEETPWRIAL